MPRYASRFAKHALGPLAIAAVLATGLAIAASPPSAQVSGPARVVDGDTLEIGDARIRLEGIDAPEADQQCRSGTGGSWPCGRAATRHLAARVGGGDVHCESRGHDRYGRMLGVCSVGQIELNADMVREGLAWAFLKYSDRYREAEAEARVLKIGIWQSETEPAWAYREKRWAKAEPAAPERCAIKGNVTRQGRIYHTPWSPWYEKTRIDPAKGERWFCSEGEALAAGWRPAHP